MNASKEQSKEMAAFCQQEAKKSKPGMFRSWIGTAVLQGVMVALLVMASQNSPEDSQFRSNPWVE